MAAPPLAIDYVESWKDRLLAGLYEQFKNDASWQAWCTDVLAPQAQAIEEAQQQLLTLLSIKYGAGLQLDRLGRLVGRRREGQVDVVYQQMLYAQILVNHSGGAGENLYAVFSALVGPGAKLLWVPGWPAAGTPGQASFELRILTPISDTLGAIGVEFLRDAKRAGVRGILEWQAQADADTFFTAQGTSVTVASSGGDTSLTVADTSMLPAAGSVLIDNTTATQETATYTVTSPTTIAVSALAHAHAVGCVVELVGEPGQGFATASALTTAAAPTDGTLTVIASLTSPFPGAGSVVVDPGMPNEETLAYSSISGGGATIHLTGTVANSHDIGAVVQLVGASVGGALANAEQA